jgi:hypothetical protein
MARRKSLRSQLSAPDVGNVQGPGPRCWCPPINFGHVECPRRWHALRVNMLCGFDMRLGSGIENSVYIHAGRWTRASDGALGTGIPKPR